jgi:hypothetical protein
MKRFYDYDPYDSENDKNEFEFDDNEEMDEDEGEIRYIEPDQLLEALHMNMSQINPDSDLMNTAVQIAENSFLWRFRSSDYKLKEIEKIFKKLTQITEDVEFYNDPPPEDN